MNDGQTNKQSILLVEDHADTREMTRRVLVRHGYRVLEASGVGEARVIATAEHLDLLVSDIGLVDGEGCALLGELRTRLPSLQAIAITGYAYPADEMRCRAAGFGWFLTKPFEIKQLIDTIKSALLAASVGAVDGRSA